MYTRIALLTLSLLLFALPVAAEQVIEVVTFDQLLTEWYGTQGAKFAEANPGIRVEARTVAGGINGLTDHITVRLASGNPPDMADNVLRVYYPWADEGYLVDMLPLLERSSVVSTRDIIPGLPEAKSYRGGLYNAPTSIDPFLTLFDAQMFEEAGLADPYALSQSGAWSWASGLDAAQKLTRTGPDGTVTQWGWAPGNNSDWSWLAYVVANGGRLLSEDFKSVEFTKGPAVEALDWIAQLYNQYEVGRRAYFQGAPLAMATGNSGGLKARYTANEQSRISAAPIAPPQAGMPSRGTMFADGPIIFNNGGDADAAWRFVEWLLGNEAQRSLADITGRIPGRLDAVSYWAELTAPYIGGAARGHVFSDAASTASLPPLGPHYNDMMRVINPAVYEIFDGKASAQSKLEEIAPQVQAVLDTHFGK